MKQIYIITYDNAQWCGGELYCLVEATDETEAEEVAGQWMWESQIELFADHYEDEPLEDGDVPVGNVFVELLEGSDYEEYAADPSQASFYPKVNYQ